MVSKAESAQTLAQVAAAIGPACALLPLIESVAGLDAADSLATCPQVLRLVFGHLDFQADAGLACEADELELLPVRLALVLASRRAAPRWLRRSMAFRRARKTPHDWPLTRRAAGVAALAASCASIRRKWPWSMRRLRPAQPNSTGPGACRQLLMRRRVVCSLWMERWWMHRCCCWRSARSRRPSGADSFRAGCANSHAVGNIGLASGVTTPISGNIPARTNMKTSAVGGFRHQGYRQSREKAFLQVLSRRPCSPGARLFWQAPNGQPMTAEVTGPFFVLADCLRIDKDQNKQSSCGVRLRAAP